MAMSGRWVNRSILPTGPELDDREQPWIVDEGRPPHHHFKGYQLDELRRPTFRYEFEDVQRRRLFSAGRRRSTRIKQSLRRTSQRCRAATSSEIEPPISMLPPPRKSSPKATGHFRSAKDLKIRLISNANSSDRRMWAKANNCNLYH